MKNYNIEFYTYYNSNSFNMNSIRRYFSKDGYSLYYYLFKNLAF